MPRTTKAQLEAENADLRAENARLKAEAGRRRERSRSPRAGAHTSIESPKTSSTAWRALHEVCKWERDVEIAELRDIITKQRYEIQSLRKGEGPVGEVLLANYQRAFPALVTDFIKTKMASSTTPVNDVFRRLDWLSSNLRNTAFWGELGV